MKIREMIIKNKERLENGYLKRLILNKFNCYKYSIEEDGEIYINATTKNKGNRLLTDNELEELVSFI